jgi:hypothetical protein
VVTDSGWRVKYEGVCSRCGRVLRAGDVAIYDRPTRSIHCVACPSQAIDVDERGLVESVFDAGTAGASAKREYERRKAQRDDRVKSRFGARLGRVILAVTDDPQSTRAWAIGARGEEKLAEALKDIEGLRVLHDRRVSGTRRNIDHILIAPAGVFVVDAKHYEGRIEIRDKGWYRRPDFRLFVGRRDCSKLAEGLHWQVEAVMVALTDAGVDPLPPVTPVLCFVDGDWPLFSAPNQFAGVRLESPKSLRTIAKSAKALDAAEIGRLATILGARLPSKSTSRVRVRP